MGRHDWLLVGGLEAVALVEGLARPDLPGQPYVTALAMTYMPVLLWRRRHPLIACLVGFGIAGALAVLQIVTRSEALGLASMMAILIPLYALARWGSGREVVAGVTCVLAVAGLGLYASAATLATVIGSIVFLLLFVTVGTVVRYRADLWQRQEREIRNAERLTLARELHDTVAHHVSAIAVQAQAARVVAQTQPHRAAEILGAIEAEASNTLTQMRNMVRILREDEEGADTAKLGVADLSALSRPDANPAVEVSVAVELTHLPRSVDTAVYRLAQEALTNAVRHASGATHVAIEVSRVGSDVRLRVVDDGLCPPGMRARPGFGLIGMTERAQLLGGSLTACPGPDGGWVVEAVIPAGSRG